MDPIQISAAQGARAKELQRELGLLRDAAYELREGEGKSAPNSEILAKAIDRDIAAKDAELHRELASLDGGAVAGAVLAKGQSMRSAISEPGSATLTQM